MTPTDWLGTRVFITGHTGFKGSWLTVLLHDLGASVHGYSLPELPTTPCLFDVARLSTRLSSDTRGDVADVQHLRDAVKRADPQVVFHLAAQPLVPASYADPLGTFQTNVMGTACLLEAIRDTNVRAVVIVTTDKVYENREWVHPYRESDRLGGHDPYSASKAAAELITASYRASFFSSEGSPRVVTARAGNVIGGGDWALNRLVPDCLRAFSKGYPVRLRRPAAVRPWQHVLEPLSGYLILAQRLLGDRPVSHNAWNFGPNHVDEVNVGKVAQTLADLWGPNARLEHDKSAHSPEASHLSLDHSLARHELGWQPRWALRQGLQATLDWYRQWLAGGDMLQLCIDQTRAFREEHQ